MHIPAHNTENITVYHMLQVHMKRTRINVEDSDHHNRRTAKSLRFKTPEDGQ
jgi:hypothetical protein